MGGPMNVDEVDRFPALAAEREWLAEAVHRELPVLGICLGAQLLARALGAEVRPGERKEIGFAPVEVADPADPVLGALAPSTDGTALARRRLRPSQRRPAIGLLCPDRAPGFPARQRLGRALPPRGRPRPGRGLAGGAGDGRRGGRGARRRGCRGAPRARPKRRSRRWSSARRRASGPSPGGSSAEPRSAAFPTVSSTHPCPPPSQSTICASPSGSSRRCAASASRSRLGKYSASSAPTAPARRRRSTCSAHWPSRPAAAPPSPASTWSPRATTFAATSASSSRTQRSTVPHRRAEPAAARRALRG